jgi:3-demethoxyubiquinol 3-hydroxylase
MISLTLTDKIIIALDTAIKTMAVSHVAARENPADQIDETALTSNEKKHIAGLMRVNHAGEISAQALYLGQAITARDPEVRDKMQIAAKEEIDHLAWCEARLKELESHLSYLSPLWFTGSFFIGTLAGIIGDQWNLGFLAETEEQVVRHLETHLSHLPENDKKTIAILEQMRDDEAKHRNMAIDAGAHPLPTPIKMMMRVISKIMTTTAYRL